MVGAHQSAVWNARRNWATYSSNLQSGLPLLLKLPH